MRALYGAALELVQYGTALECAEYGGKIFFVGQLLSAGFGTVVDIDGMTNTTLQNANWSWELDTGSGFVQMGTGETYLATTVGNLRLGLFFFDDLGNREPPLPTVYLYSDAFPVLPSVSSGTANGAATINALTATGTAGGSSKPT